MAATAAPPNGASTPYVSLLDQLTALGDTLNASGGETVPPGKIGSVLTALVHYAEHGQDLVDAHQLGGYGRVEPLLTPDRPEGWAPPVVNLDPKDLEIERLKAQLAQLQHPVIDPRDAELEALRAQVAQAGTASDAPDTPRPGEWAAPRASEMEPDVAAEMRRVQEEAARRGTEQGTRVEVEHDPGYRKLTDDEVRAEAERRGLNVADDDTANADDYRAALAADDKARGERERGDNQ